MNTYPLLITLIAGLSTILGYFVIYIKGNTDKIISKALSFAGGVMVTLSITDLIPNSIKYFKVFNIKNLILFLVSFFIGFLLSHILNKYIREEGLYKTGIVSMIGIMLHNIPEGIATYMLSTIDLKLGLVLGIAIILHNIPEGISIAIPIYYGTDNKLKALFYTFVSGFSEFIGALLTLIFLNKYMNSNILGILFSIISGLMIYIGYYELIKSSLLYDKKETYIWTFIGALFIVFVEILLKI